MILAGVSVWGGRKEGQRAAHTSRIAGQTHREVLRFDAHQRALLVGSGRGPLAVEWPHDRQAAAHLLLLRRTIDGGRFGQLISKYR